MAPTPFICNLVCTTLVACCTPPATAGIYGPELRHVPVVDWPEQRELPESSHTPHEERFLRVTVDSGASGALVNNSTHVSTGTYLPWLRNELGEKLLVVPDGGVNVRFLTTQTATSWQVEGCPTCRPFNAVPSRRQIVRIRRGC